MANENVEKVLGNILALNDETLLIDVFADAKRHELDMLWMVK